jgi:hypothetical protein
VVLDCYYYNDQPRQFEGTFQLRLPNDASPFFFAFGQTVYRAAVGKPNQPVFFPPEQVGSVGFSPTTSSPSAATVVGTAEGRPGRAEGEGRLRLSRDRAAADRSGADGVVGGGRVQRPRLPAYSPAACTAW